VTNVLPYHTGPEDRYSLDFVNPEWSEFTDYLAERSMEQGVSVKAREISVETDDGINTLYAVYSRTVPDMLVNSPTEEEISVILDEQYTEAQPQILEVILDIFAGITETVEAGPGRFQIYKDMDLEKIPEVLEYPGWRKSRLQSSVGSCFRGSFCLIQCQMPITGLHLVFWSGICGLMETGSPFPIQESEVCGTSGPGRTFTIRNG